MNNKIYVMMRTWLINKGREQQKSKKFKLNPFCVKMRSL